MSRDSEVGLQPPNLWEEEGERFPGGIPLSHMANPEWLRRSDMGPGGTLCWGEKHDRLGGGAPLALMWTVDRKVIERPRILRWRTSRRDRLIASVSTANKPPDLTALHDAKKSGGDTCLVVNRNGLFRPPKTSYPPRLLASERMRVVDPLRA